MRVIKELTKRYLDIVDSHQAGADCAETCLALDDLSTAILRERCHTSNREKVFLLCNLRNIVLNESLKIKADCENGK